MTIRAYQRDDEQGLRACVHALQQFERTLNPLTAETSDMVDVYLHELFAARDTTLGQVFVKLVDGRVVGFVAVQAVIANQEPHEVPYEYAYISEIAIVPEFRGHGYGKALLERAQTYAREKGAWLLRVGALSQNRRAIDLYKRLGFEEHAVLLQKDLR